MKTEIIPSYNASLLQLRDNLKNMLPSQALTDFDTYAEHLNKTIHDVLKLKVGDTAPFFTLSNQLGNAVSLTDLLKQGKVILVFYRGGWCPYCNLQLNLLQGALTEFTSRNARLVAVSPQTPDSSLSMAEKNQLEFEVLSDVGNTVARKFTTVFRHDDKATEVLQSLGIDFSNHYGDDSNEVPVPAMFVIDQDGRIAFAKSEGGDFRQRVELAEIIEAL